MLLVTKSKNYQELNNLLSVYDENLASLNNMGFKTDDWDFLLFYLFSRHFDKDTFARFEFEETENADNIPKFETLKNFVSKQCRALDIVGYSLENSTSSQKPPRHNSFRHAKSKQTNSLFAKNNNSNTSVSCYFCKANHFIYKCGSFQKNSPRERLNIAQKHNWCIHCLSPMHGTRGCKSRNSCLCNSKHHTLLHNLQNPNNDAESVKGIPNQEGLCLSEHQVPDPAAPTNKFCSLICNSSSVLLSTAIADVLDVRGSYQKDCGSQTNYISQKCSNRLGLPCFYSILLIQSLGNMLDKATDGEVSCIVKPFGKSSPNITIDAIILLQICPEMPSTPIDWTNWEHVQHLRLADPQYFKTSGIVILLGADIFPRVLRNGRVSGGIGEPVAINTIFSWVIMGKFEDNSPSRTNAVSLFSKIDLEQTNDVNSSIKRFWKIEEIPQSPATSLDEQMCEDLFLRTHSRDDTGRYIVELPLKEDEPRFESEDSRSLALRRLYSLEKRLSNNPEQYSDFMQEYLSAGCMEEIVANGLNSSKVFYIPHPCVLKPESTTTKLRVVSDASAKTNLGSLNDKLLCCLKLQKDITAVLSGFRVHLVVFTCDIKAMFNQILVAEKHQDYQRILWRFSSQDPLDPGAAQPR
ncbi:hypothetical protein ILUMI_16233, partial [Ignelater luminosus]